MKKSDIEKQLRSELSTAAPSDFDAVWNKCVTPSASEVEATSLETVQAGIGNGNGVYRSRVKKVSLIALACVALCCIAVLLYFWLVGRSGVGLVLPSQSGYFTIDVNPSIQVYYDENGVITDAQGLNADGEQLLSPLDLNGKTYDKAVSVIFDRCVSLGYFSAEHDDNAMLMTASNLGGEKDEDMTAEISKYLTQAFTDKKMLGAVISDVDNSKWQKEGEKYGINGQKYEFIMRYIDKGGELDEAEYGSITIRELYSKMKELDDKDDKPKTDTEDDKSEK